MHNTKRFAMACMLVTCVAFSQGGSAEMNAADCATLKKLIYIDKSEIEKARGEFLKQTHQGGNFDTSLSIPGFGSCMNIIDKRGNNNLKCETDVSVNTKAFEKVEEVLACVVDLLRKRQLYQVWFEDEFRLTRFDGEVLLSEPRNRLKAAQRDFVTLRVKTKYAWKGELSITLWYRYK